MKPAKEKSARLEGAEADCYKEKAKRTALAQRYFDPFERWFVVGSVTESIFLTAAKKADLKFPGSIDGSWRTPPRSTILESWPPFLKLDLQLQVDQDLDQRAPPTWSPAEQRMSDRSFSFLASARPRSESAIQHGCPRPKVLWVICYMLRAVWTTSNIGALLNWASH